MSRAILIRGPLGVGKTTVARELCRRNHGCYISFDQILDDHGLNPYEDGVHESSFLRANKIALPVALEALRVGRLVVFDGCFYFKSQIEQLLENLPEPVYIFSLIASVEECISRDKGREKVYGEGAATWVHYLVSRFEVGIPITTEGKTSDQVVEEIEAQISSSNDH